ncbi:MAG: Holliday junction resolvase RuvX [Candidatus Omnitrophica bacterium]|nr:Holliday junction resolvase RuvX [Candidatus Omnitrophota bacterium]
MRTLALDVGDRRIGVAISDQTDTIATGISVIERKTLENDINIIIGFIRHYQPNELVVGLPITMKGTESKQTQKVNKFINQLKEKISIPIVPYCERLSTKEGERLLLSADVSRKKRKSLIDKVAAQIILQTYLDSKGGHIDPDA